MRVHGDTLVYTCSPASTRVYTENWGFSPVFPGVNAAQYMQFFGHKRTFPAHLIFPDSPRYKNKKPMPGNNLFVSVSGFLSRVAFKEPDPSQHNPMHEVQHFIIDIDTIVFLGRVPLTPASPTKPGTYCVHLFLLYV